MDTRKLLAALALTCSSLTLFATASQHSIHPSIPECRMVHPAVPPADIAVYQDANGSNVVKWKAEGVNDLEYLLQGSKDGKAFRLIKKITAAAHSEANGQYEAADNTGRGYTHFRIIRIDQGGHVSYSKIVSAP